MLQSISKRLRTLLLIGSLFLNALLLTATPVSVIEEEAIFNDPPILLLTGAYEKVDLSFRLIEYAPLSVEEQINKYILELSTLYDLDPYIIHSIVWHESRYKPEAVASNGVCLGLMQVCTTWHMSRAEKLGVTDFHDIYGGLLLGIDYFSELIHSTNDVGLALMLYNMNHSKAYALHSKGELSSYATSVLNRAEALKIGT